MRIAPALAAQNRFRNNLPTLLRWPIAARRWVFLLAASGLICGLATMMVATLARGGFGAVDLLLTALFTLTLPWTAIGFLNALIGLVITRTAAHPELAVCPVDVPPAGTPLRGSTAIAVCIRNEDVDSVARNLENMLADLERAGVAERFHGYVLSDSDEDTILAQETRAIGPMTMRRTGHIPVEYRRRQTQAGFKAGNIRDFLSRWGHRHDYMLVLDADSLMTAEAIIKLVRVMDTNPRLGILQSLINGLPALSAFSRVFQFGMRLGMRSYTIGSAWWQADCGPYWGHNALIRIAPFIEHCELPTISAKGALGGCILSHDQVEAVLMRRAGFEVRVLADASGSYEENPPSLVEFVRRDLRWCLGNMQYLRLLRMPGLHMVSRVQLVLAILMFAGSPAWMAFVVLGAIQVGLADNPVNTIDPRLGTMLFACVLGMVFAPKIASIVDLLLKQRSRRAFGGHGRVLVSAVGEAIFSALLAPIMAIAHTRFIAGLPFGRKTTWASQRRGAHRVGVLEGWTRFWPQTLAGAAFLLWIGVWTSVPLWSVLPLGLGPLLVIPLAVFTASAVGTRLFAMLGLWRTPEEIDPPANLATFLLPGNESLQASCAQSSAPTADATNSVPAFAVSTAK